MRLERGGEKGRGQGAHCRDACQDQAGWEGRGGSGQMLEGPGLRVGGSRLRVEGLVYRGVCFGGEGMTVCFVWWLEQGR